MKNWDLYNELANRHYPIVIEAIRDDREQRPLLALAFALNDKHEDANRILKTIDFQRSDEEDLGMCAEAEIVIAAFERKPLAEIEKLARKALSHDEKALFALHTLGQIAERQRRPKDALSFYQDILKTYPDRNSTLLGCARTCFQSRQSKEAFTYLNRARRSVLRTAYSIIGPLFYSRIFYLVGFLYTILIWIPIITFPVFFTVAAICILGGIITIIKREPFLFSAFTKGLLNASVIFFIRVFIGGLSRI
jgi:tetratricopeptide (TPR) repeat protein